VALRDSLRGGEYFVDARHKRDAQKTGSGVESVDRT
jgi:hypothetical protein